LATGSGASGSLQGPSSSRFHHSMRPRPGCVRECSHQSPPQPAGTGQTSRCSPWMSTSAVSAWRAAVRWTCPLPRTSCTPSKPGPSLRTRRADMAWILCTTHHVPGEKSCKNSLRQVHVCHPLLASFTGPPPCLQAFDGGSRGNPGVAGSGAVLYHSDEDLTDPSHHVCVCVCVLCVSCV
jgi:hypothetical protein